MGKAAACLWLCWDQQRGAGTTRSLPFHRSRINPLLFAGKILLESGVAPVPVTFPGCLRWGGGVPAPQEPFSRCPAGMSAAGRAGTGLSTVTLNSGLSFS